MNPNRERSLAPRSTTPLAPRGAVSAMTVEQARIEIVQARHRVQEGIHSIQAGMTKATDWRNAARKHPIIAAVIALSAGLLVSQIFRRRR